MARDKRGHRHAAVPLEPRSRITPAGALAPTSLAAEHGPGEARTRSARMNMSENGQSCQQARPIMVSMSPRAISAQLSPWLDGDQAYQALSSRDARFDGRFFVGVTSTGIYCRPICRVRLPKRDNCRFFGNAATAEQAGFRPCLRCRPELAPGLALSDNARTLAHAGAQWIALQLAQGESATLPALASHLGVSERHVRRIFSEVHGVSPLAWTTTQRLLWAKRLLTDTRMGITEVAQCSGFGSVRRFNAALAQHYRLTPSAIRRERAGPSTLPGAVLRLPWRAPYDAQAMQAFLAARPLPGVEVWSEGRWWRTLQLRAGNTLLKGWLALRFDTERGEAQAEVAPALAPALGQVALMLRHLLDLDTDTQAIDQALQTTRVGGFSGLRMPGCVDGFETTVRIILGQQITVAAACTLCARLVERWAKLCRHRCAAWTGCSPPRRPCWRPQPTRWGPWASSATAPRPSRPWPWPCSPDSCAWRRASPWPPPWRRSKPCQALATGPPSWWRCACWPGRTPSPPAMRAS